MADVGIRKVGFNLKSDVPFDEKAVLDAMNNAFSGSTMLKKPS